MSAAAPAGTFDDLLEAALPPGGSLRARRLQADTGERLDRLAAKLGLVSDTALANLYGRWLGSDVLSQAEYPTKPVAPDRLTPTFLRHARIVPISESDQDLLVAMEDPLNDQAVRALEFALEKPVHRRVGLPADIRTNLIRLYGQDETTAQLDPDDRLDEDRDADLDRIKDMASEAPVIRLVNAIIEEAVAARASDIHLESTEAGLRVRYRIDGVLRDMQLPPAPLKAAIISRVKIMARLNIAERRLAQDGRIRQVVRGQEIDLRVSTTPAIHGESVVLRILDRGALALDFASIGFDAELLTVWREITSRAHGIVLVTGPTGSGKTTTLYTTLRALNATERKILTVEDPVEFILAGVNQVQVNKVHHVHTIARVAEMLGEDEVWLWDVANEMDAEDGLIWVYGPGDDGVMAFTDFGIETLTGIIKIYKADPDQLKPSSNLE